MSREKHDYSDEIASIPVDGIERSRGHSPTHEFKSDTGQRCAELSSFCHPRTAEIVYLLEIDRKSANFDLQIGSETPLDYIPRENLFLMSATETGDHYLHIFRDDQCIYPESILMYSNGTSQEGIPFDPSPDGVRALGINPNHPDWNLVKLGDTRVYIKVTDNPSFREREEIHFGEQSSTRERWNLEKPPDDEITLLGERDPRFEPVYVDAKAILLSASHFMASANELGGTLAGRFCRDSTGTEFTRIEDYIADSHGISREGSYTFTSNSWAEANRVIDIRGTGLTVVGWDHSHPDGYPPVPTQGYDTEIMRHFFSLPEQLTVIMGRNGEKWEIALWRWDQETKKPVLQKGIYLVGDPSEGILQDISYYNPE